MASEAWVIGGCQIVPGQQGGMAIGGFPANRCEKFGAAPVAATPAAAILNDRMDMGVCVAKVSGLAVMAGGNELNGQSLDTTNTTEIYDPNANSWAAGPTLNIPRWATAVAEIGTTSDMLIVGGIDANNALMVTCEVMGMAQGAILGTVDMATARSDFPAVTLNDGRIMVIGGLDDQGAGLAQTEFHTR